MSVEIITFKITGTSPLMQSNPIEFIGKESDGGMTAGKKTYNDEEEAEKRVYRNADGQFVHPTSSFRAALGEASKGRKIGKTAARMVLAGAVFPAEQECLILDETEKAYAKYEIDRRPVVIGKARVLRCRPSFPKWKMLLPLEIETDLVAPSIVLEVLNLAGKNIGVGEFRPDPSNGKKGTGWFGRFTAEIV